MIEMSKYGETLFSYQGNGQLQFFDNKVYECSFEAAQFADGSIKVKCRIENVIGIANSGALASGNDWIDLKGTTKEGEKLSVQGSALTDVDILMRHEGSHTELLFMTFGDAKMCLGEPEWEGSAELRFGLTNFNFTGNVMKREIDGSYGLTVLQLKIGDVGLIIHQLSEYRERIALLEARGGIHVTSEAILEIQNSNEIDQRKDLIQTLSDMLSLARGTSVTSTYMKIFNQESCIYIESWNHSTGSYSGTRPVGNYSGARPIIDLENSEDTKRFVESTYKRFVDLSSDYNMLGIIQLLAMTRSKNIIEVQGITLGSLADYITSIYMSKERQETIINQITFDERRDRLKVKVREAIKEIFSDVTKSDQRKEMTSKIVGFNYPDFKNKLKKYCRQLKAPISDSEIDEFIGNRNKLTHTMKFTDDDDKFKCYFSMLHFIDRVLLAMLQYEGSYMNVTTSPSTKENFKLTS